MQSPRKRGLVLLCRDLKDEGRLKNVTNVKCFVSNERSKGSFRVWSGHHPVITETTDGFQPWLFASTTEVTSALGVSEKNPQESWRSSLFIASCRHYNSSVSTIKPISCLGPWYPRCCTGRR